MAPELPRGFVPRPREFEALLRLVLDPDQAHPKTITGLQGSGGYGKTTLAIALCHDERVAAAFDDGVLWASLGQTPSVRDELARWYEALTGQSPASANVSDVAAKLAGKLEHRQCLLVIDDVWDHAHLEPFLRGGSQCARVVTTRRVDLLSGAPRVRIDEMSVAEAQHLMGMVLPTGAVSCRLPRLARQAFRRMATAAETGSRDDSKTSRSQRFRRRGPRVRRAPAGQTRGGGV